MASFTKINDFVEDLGDGVHDLTNDTLSVALSNTAPGSETSDPSADGNGVLANVTQIAYTNYSDDLTVDRTLESVTWSLSSGTATLDAGDFTITAAGGSIATFRYIYIYNNTPTSPADPLIGYYDNGSAVDLADGESLSVQFDASGILTVT